MAENEDMRDIKSVMSNQTLRNNIVTSQPDQVEKVPTIKGEVRVYINI